MVSPSLLKMEPSWFAEADEKIPGQPEKPFLRELGIFLPRGYVTSSFLGRPRFALTWGGATGLNQVRRVLSV